MFQRILVSFDGSDHAKAALLLAIDVAGKYQSDLEIVHVPEVETTPVAMGGPAFVAVPQRQEQVKQKAEEVLAEATEIAKQAGFDRASTRILTGPTAEAILHRAQDAEIELIVAGRRGHGTLLGLLVGSVSHKLVSHATCPVLTVQKPAA